jgi:MOSC domain-containing protein YiiM
VGDQLTARVEALLIGQPRPFGDTMSAIAKTPVAGPVAIGVMGLAGDAVAEPDVHGGADKALHLYPRDHYPFWRRHVGPHALLDAPGAFGENIAAWGLTEDRCCIGDRFTLGTALVEISHGRQPCWKLDLRFGDPSIVRTVVATGRCGLYLRVIHAGEAAAGGVMSLVDRPHPEWTVARVFDLLIAGGHRRDPGAVAALAALPALAEAWRSRAAELARLGRPRAAGGARP